MKKKRLVAFIIIAMRITIVQIALVITLMGAAYANSTKAQILNRPVSINAQNAEIKAVIASVKEQIGIKFIFSTRLIKADRKISCDVKSKKLSEFLNEVLLPLNIGYEIFDNQILLYPLPVKDKNSVEWKDFFYKAIPSLTITGTVTDAKGQPLEGVSIKVKSTGTVAVSGKDGKFSINVPNERAILIFSYVSYETQEMAIGKNTRLSVLLKEDISKLDEVVVVGYGTRKISDLTGAVSNIKAENTNTGGASTAVDQMLAGRVAGVQFKQNTAQPGGGGTMIIRGRNSLYLNSDPLYVIDGFIVNSPGTPSTGSSYFGTPDRDPLNSINPNDIESIAVLKDAAATAIYGAKGSNGVILITTKRGRKGSTKVSYDGYESVQTIAKKFDVLTAPEYMNFWNKLGSTNFTASQISSAQTTNWFDLITRNGNIQSHNLNLSAATDNLNYFFSLGYFDNEGIVKNSNLQRLSGRGNLQYKKDKFTFNSNIFATNIVNNNQQSQGGTRSSVIASALTFAPYLSVRDANGDYNRDPLNNFLNNPVSMLDISDKLITDKMNFSVGADYEIAKGLKPEIRATYDLQNDSRSFYVPTTTPYNGSLSHGGTGSQSTQRSAAYTIDALLHYDLTFSKIHHFTALVGYEYFYRKYNQFYAFNSGFGSNITLNNNLGSGTSAVVYSSKTDKKDISAFGRLDYTLNDKYLATVTLRKDGSSVFGENNKFAVFPGVSVGWKLDKEDFMRDRKAIDLLKLRVGYGITGNSGIDPYQSLAKYDQGVNSINTSPILGEAPVSGVSLAAIKANPDLKWESTSQLNIGLDYGFFKRVNGSLDFFVKNTKDMLLQVNLPATTGYTTQWENAATMRTWGLEFSINSANIKGKNFQWNTNFNISWLGNKIEQYNTSDSTTISALNDIGVIKGKRTNSYYTYIVTGIDPATGSFKFKPSKEIVGSPDPKFILGMGNTFSYQRWTFNFFMNASLGGKLHNQMLAQYATPNANGIANGFKEMLNYWTITNTSSNIPANANSGSGSFIYNSRWIENASFLRMQNVSLSYTIPSTVMKSAFSSARVYAQVQNLFVITDYSGMDPEAANNNYISKTENMPAFLPGNTDVNAYPAARTFTFGINLQFR